MRVVEKVEEGMVAGMEVARAVEGKVVAAMVVVVRAEVVMAVEAREAVEKVVAERVVEAMVVAAKAEEELAEAAMVAVATEAGGMVGVVTAEAERVVQ